MKNIVLTGFMGTGKSSVGRQLASELGCKYLDIDTVIVKVSGKSIPDIFKEYGEEHFRGMESLMVERLVAGDFGVNIVVSTGGGTVISDSCRSALKGWGTVVCLTARIDIILSRIGSGEGRPLASGTTVEGQRAAFTELLRSREKFYTDCDLRIDTSSRTVSEVVEAIMSYLDNRAD